MRGHTFKRCSCEQPDDGSKRTCSKRHGSWYFAHDLPAGPGGRRRQVKQGGFPTEREARRALNDSMAQVARGTWVEQTRMSVGEYLDIWIAGKRRLKASTRRSYCEHIELYLRPVLGHLRLTELRDTDIERLYAAMAQLGPDLPTRRSPELAALLEVRAKQGIARPLSDARIRRVHATLMSALNSAGATQVLVAQPGSAHRARQWTPPAGCGLER
jgi:hypothetical protein